MLGIKDALALHLGGVCGQYGRDVGMPQRACNVARADIRLRETLETEG